MRRDLLALAALALAFLLAEIVINVWSFLMKHALRLAVICVLGLALAGCGTINPFAINARTTPAAQLVQAEAKAALDRALAARLEYCDIRGTLGADLNVSAAPGAGFNVGGSFTCPPRPWSPEPVPLKELGKPPVQ